MKIYVNSGAIATVEAPRDIASGELFRAGAMIGFAQADAAEGELVAIVTEGVFELEVLAASDLEVGDVVFLDETDTLVADSDAAGAVRAGIVYGPGASDGVTAVVNVKINA